MGREFLFTAAQPVDLDLESALSEEVHSWFAFAKQKVSEVVLLGRALDGNEDAIAQCAVYSQPIQARKSASHVHKPQVQARVNAISPAFAKRSAPYVQRSAHQAEVLKLPLLPTTTIGSFPQTAEIRFSAVPTAQASCRRPSTPKR